MDDSVTITKAFGIMLMVLAHSWFSYFGDAVINMFHMPLFFFMSGYCFSDHHLAAPWQWFKGKVRKIYLPYIKYSLLFLCFHNVLYSLHIYSQEYNLHECVFRASHIIVTMGAHDGLLGGYWFMGCLFWGLIISFALLKIIRNNAIVCCALTLVVSMVMNYYDFILHGINLHHFHFFSASFILAGIEYKRREGAIEPKLTILMPLSVVLVLIGTIYWRGCVPIIDTWKTIPYFVTAILGTVTVFVLSRKIVKRFNPMFLKNIGGGTLSILTWHFLCFKMVSFLIITIYDLPIEKLIEFPVLHYYAGRGWWMAYFIVGISVPLFIDKLIETSKKTFYYFQKK